MTPRSTLTDRARVLSAGLLNALGGMLGRAGVHPDTLTILGLVVVAGAALLLADGRYQAGALVLLAGLPLDALDGAVARAIGRRDRFGAMLDSTLDRYTDAFIFIGLGYHFAVQDRFDLLLLALIALLGSLAVSYIRARAEGLGLSVKDGWFSRLERLIVILAMLLLPALLPLGLLVLAVGTHLTSAQRLWIVYKALKQED